MAKKGKRKEQINPKQLAADGFTALIVGILLMLIDKYII